MKPKLLGIQQKILMKSVGNLWRKFKILYKHNSYKAIPKLFIVCQFSFTQIFNSSLCITAYDVMLWCAIGIKTKKIFMFLIRIIPKVACFASGKTNYLKRLLLSFLFLYTFDCFVFCTSCFDEKENHHPGQQMTFSFSIWLTPSSRYWAFLFHHHIIWNLNIHYSHVLKAICKSLCQVKDL